LPATAIIPVKLLVEAKTRLALELTADERARLALTLLRNVLDAATAATLVSRTLVVTPDPLVAELARVAGVEVLFQDQPGLNLAVRMGRVAAETETILALLGDLPFLTGTELDSLLCVVAPDGIVLAPDRHGRGTNALAIHRAVPFAPAFGVDSLASHHREAARRGLEMREYRSHGTGFDVDTVEDFHEYQRILRETAAG
jgi:2-phospho-L-lactate guanylyltransferase